MNALVTWLALLLSAGALLLKRLRQRRVITESNSSTSKQASEGAMIQRDDHDLVDDGPQPTPLASILLRNEPFQYSTVDVAEKFAAAFETITVVQGQQLAAEQYALSFVLQGSVQAKLPKYTGDEDIAFKLIRQNGSLTPVLLTLSALLRLQDTFDRNDSLGQQLPEEFRLHATEDSTIAVLSTSALQELMLGQRELISPLVDVLLRRLYFTTLPFAQTYIGLEQDILDYEESMSMVDLPWKDSWHDSVARLRSLHKVEFQEAFRNGTRKVPGHELTSIFDSKAAGIKDDAEKNETIVEHALQCEPESSPGKDLRVEIPTIRALRRSDTGTDLSLPSALTQLEGLTNVLHGRRLHPTPHAKTIKAIVAELLFKALDIRSSMLSNSDLKLQDRNLPDNFVDCVELCFFQQGSVLARKGHRIPGIYLLIEGGVELEAFPRTDQKCCNTVLKDGSVLGYNSILANSRALFDVTATSDVYAGFISRERLSDLRSQRPDLLLNLAHKVLAKLPSSLQFVHFATDYISYAADEVVYRKGDESHSFYTVASGRLRITEDAHKVGEGDSTEFGKGQSVGAFELYLARKRPSTLRAIRRSHVLQMQKMSFKALAYNNPALAFRLSEVLAGSAPTYIERSSNKERRHNDDSTIQTIAIVPLSPLIPASEFARHLTKAIGSLHLAAGVDPPILTASTMKISPSIQATEMYGESVLENYLSQIEDNAPLVLYVADSATVTTSWSKTCVAHADVILFLGTATDDCEVTFNERQLVSDGKGAQKKLILLHHQKRKVQSGLTADWMKHRPWLTAGAQHILMPPSLGCTTCIDYTPRGERLPLRTGAEFERLARRLLGKSIALVLGGGGARGVSHLGFLKAFEERGIPVDIVGGTSIGSFVGAIYANNLTWKTTYDIVRHFSLQLSPRKFLLDITYPWLSLTTGRRFNRLLQKAFGDSHLDDTWIEYYCAVTNLSQKATPKILTRGTAWDIVRASMSFVGFVPPLWKDGELLIDGCYSNNNPVSHAAALNADIIFAIDVGIDMTIDADDWGAELSAWSMILNRFFPNKRNPPRYSWVMEILTQAVSEADLHITKGMANCYYTRPPVGMYRATDFASFDKIFHIGYGHAIRWLDDLEKNGKLDRICVSKQ